MKKIIEYALGSCLLFLLMFVTFVLFLPVLGLFEFMHQRDFMGKCLTIHSDFEMCLDAWEAEIYKRGLFQYEVNDEN